MADKAEEGRIQKPDEGGWQNGSSEDEKDIDGTDCWRGEVCKLLCDREHGRGDEYDWQKPLMSRKQDPRGKRERGS